MKNEIWKAIENYNDYEISNQGRVRSNRSKNTKILKNQKDGQKYHHVVIVDNNNNRKMRKVHLLVAEAFLGHKKSKGLVVDHIDNNNQNNSIDNLQIITQRKNTSKDKHNKTSIFQGVSWHKLTEKYIAHIHAGTKVHHLGSFVDEKKGADCYNSALDFCEKNGFTDENIILFKKNMKEKNLFI